MLLALPLSCNPGAHEDDAYLQKAPPVNVGAILGHNKADVAKVLGKPTSDLPPGKINPKENLCSYKWSEADTLGVLVSFVSGKAATIYMAPKRPMHSPEAAVRLLGVDMAGKQPDTSTPAGRWWKGTFNGTTFSRIGSTKSAPDSEEWGYVRAEL